MHTPTLFEKLAKYPLLKIIITKYTNTSNKKVWFNQVFLAEISKVVYSYFFVNNLNDQKDLKTSFK